MQQQQITARPCACSPPEQGTFGPRGAMASSQSQGEMTHMTPSS